MMSTERPGYVLFLLCAVYSLSVFDRNILSILLQPIQSDLGLSDTQLGFVSGLAFAIFYVTLAVPIARLADLWKRTRIIALSLAAFSVMTALCGFVQNFWHLLLARIGVGIGEAGTTPSSTAIIADLYPERSRGRAMAWFAIGGSSGIFLGYAAGGIMAQTLGWRAAFWLAALPGLLLALLIHLTVREPRRGLSDAVAADNAGKPSTRQVIDFLWRQRSLRHLTAGTALVLLFGYGFQTWLPSYFQRSHGMSVGQVGFILGIPAGILGVVGMLSAGALADRIGIRDMRWRSWIVSIAVGVTFPFCVLVVLAPGKLLALAAYAIPAALGTFYIAPVFALVQSLVPPTMRAMALASVIAVANVVGMGLGPQWVGIASDLLNEHFGAQSLRYALLISTPILLWAAVHFYRAAAHLPGDLERARRGAALLEESVA